MPQRSRGDRVRIHLRVVGAPVRGRSGCTPGDIDLLVVGTPQVDAVYDVAEKAAIQLSREVNPTVLTRDEWEASSEGFIAQLRRSPLVSLDLARHLIHVATSCRPGRQYHRWSPGAVSLPAARKPSIAGRGKETPVELKDYIRIIRKRWRIIVAAMLVVLAGAALATALSPKVYEAQTRLFVSTSGGSDSSALLQGSSFTQQRVKSYA
ncbi:MAG TPA: Wzz/FepE/Etk N-terminal domain-containing protein, partial [Dermatophilaceae bacterium]